MKRNGALHQITISSARRDRCTAQIAAAGEELQREIAVRHRVQRVGRRPVEAQRRARSSSRSIGNEVPASAAEPSGHSFSRAPAVGQAAAVAVQHLDIGQQMVAERHRLRGLQMGEARHRIGGMLARPARASARITSASCADSPSIASRTHRRKSVATWSLRLRAGVQPLAGLADALGQPRLDVHVDVFQRHIEREACRSRSRAAIASRPARDGLLIFGADDARSSPASPHGPASPGCPAATACGRTRWRR